MQSVSILLEEVRNEDVRDEEEVIDIGVNDEDVPTN